MQNKGVIISSISNLYKVEDMKTNNIYKCMARGKFKELEIIPTVGDFVKYEVSNEEKSEGVINEIYERDNYIKRPKMANVTQIAFIVSMKMPKPDLLMLDKQLAFAELNNLKSIICLNKIDLEKEEFINEITNVYSNIGYTVIRTNAKEKKGINKLVSLLDKNITAFAGNSGVGKSTLINDIFDGDLTKEGMISQKNQRGKNTTTNTFLYKLNKDTYIADTPGFSTFDISEIKSENLYKYFKEFKVYEKECEFVGCTHIKEENCGIKKAMEMRKISKGRYERFCKIYSELKEKELKKW